MFEGIALGLIIFFVVECLLLLTLVVWERPVFAALSVAAFVATSDILFKAGMVTAVIANPLNVIVVFAAYIVLGVAWSVPKWWFHVRKIRDEYVDLLSKFKRNHGVPDEKTIGPDLMRQWREAYARATSFRDQSFPPLASESKSQIMTWMMYWPWSFVWTMIDEPFKRAFNFIFEQFKGVYQRISERAFEGVEGLE